mmetsp:Transcript_40957/g.73603  ORF Transcript_40957/g.73603 Transcript_40957/m.73603 type:complete len:316 (-) Transcript_40957:295-1242(-)
MNYIFDRKNSDTACASKVNTFRHDDKCDCQVHTSAASALPTQSIIEQRYILGEVLGYGNFATVRVAVDRETGKEWACKTVTEVTEMDMLLREVRLLEQLNHPNILSYREHVIENKELYIITELLHGSDLLTALLARGSYTEDDARHCTKQLLSALAYMSERGIVHRDLKLENIVLSDAMDFTTLKIIDFGLGDQLTKKKLHLTQACGTPLFAAPEVISERPVYGTSCDVWAVGVALFALLSGDYPYMGTSLPDLLRRIKSAPVRFSDPVWEITSPEAKDFVHWLLTKSATSRPTASQALTHRWLADDSSTGSSSR